MNILSCEMFSKVVLCIVRVCIVCYGVEVIVEIVKWFVKLLGEVM